MRAAAALSCLPGPLLAEGSLSPLLSCNRNTHILSHERQEELNHPLVAAPLIPWPSPADDVSVGSSNMCLSQHASCSISTYSEEHIVTGQSRQTNKAYHLNESHFIPTFGKIF